MSRVLRARDVRRAGSHAFLPRLASARPPACSRPLSDRTDGKIAHLDGLNLSRAWALRSIAPPVDRPDLADRADRHLAAACPMSPATIWANIGSRPFALLALTA